MLGYAKLRRRRLYDLTWFYRKYRSWLSPAGLRAHLEDRAVVGGEGPRRGRWRGAGRRGHAKDATAAQLAALRPQLRRRGP